jgi:SH3-like domain-containing protein
MPCRVSTPARLAWMAGCVALLLAGPAAGQSSLGGQPSLAPPAPVAPTGPAAPPRPPQAAAPSAQRPAPQRPTPPAGASLREAVSRPAAAGQARPPVATRTTQPRPTTATPANRPASTTAARPASGATQQRATAQAPQTAQQRRRAAAAATATAGAAGAAGAAVAARPPPAPAPPPEPPPPRFGSATNLPLPRYASLGSNQVNLRVGPDLRYPIEWTYQRKDLPVQIVDEHQLWRRIRDPEGTEGWVQRPLLNSRRSFLIPSGADRLLRRKPEEAAAEVARLRPGVVGRIRKCDAGSAWCEVQVGDYRGFIRRAEIWGVAQDEPVN